MSLKVRDRRLRFVIMYDSISGDASQLKYVTLIRETQEGGTQFTEPDTTMEQLQGRWEGSLSILHATMEPMAEGHSQWRLDSSVLECVDTFEQRNEAVHLSTTDGTTAQNRFLNLKGDLTYHLICLPNGAYCLLPHVVEKNTTFRIEVGWLLTDGRRLRLVRYYDSHSVWTDAALIEDRAELQRSINSKN